MQQAFQFGKNLIGREQAFLVSRLCYAFTNRKPVLPGHILVAPQRLVERFADLSTEEVTDMFGCVHRIVPVLERVYSASSLTIVVQDGKDAGQSVKHVHVHLLPRKPGDFEKNDDIYNVLETHDKASSRDSSHVLKQGSHVTEREESGFRTLAEMEQEAKMLSVHFN